MRRTPLAAFLLVLLCAAPIAAQTATGTWDTTLNTPQGTFNVQLILKQTGDKVTGVVKSQAGETPIEGTATAKDVNLKYKIKWQDNDMVITLTGALEASSMKGTADYGGLASGEFNSKRAGESPSASADVTGAWAVQVETPNGTGSPTFTFKQEGEKLSGQYKGAFGEAPLTGTVKENKIEFTLKVEAQGQALSLTYTGTIEKDGTMKGTVKLGEAASGTWTGKRQ
jgi:hypothetical protein